MSVTPVSGFSLGLEGVDSVTNLVLWNGCIAIASFGWSFFTFSFQLLLNQKEKRRPRAVKVSPKTRKRAAVQFAPAANDLKPKAPAIATPTIHGPYI